MLLLRNHLSRLKIIIASKSSIFFRFSVLILSSTFAHNLISFKANFIMSIHFFLCLRKNRLFSDFPAKRLYTTYA
jgi:hypothetical protein